MDARDTELLNREYFAKLFAKEPPRKPVEARKKPKKRRAKK